MCAGKVCHAILSSTDLKKKKTAKKKNNNSGIPSECSLNTDQAYLARRFIRPDLGPKCLQMLSAGDNVR